MTTRKVYSSGGSNSGYHLGSANQKITKNARPDEAVPHNGKPYVDIKKHCVKEGVLFEDPDFPAVDGSLFFSKKPPKPFVWKRPKVWLYIYTLYLNMLSFQISSVPKYSK